MNIVIRPFRSSDLDRLVAITVESFDGVSIDQNIEAVFGVIHGHQWPWRKARHIHDDVARDADGIFVAEARGDAIGFIATRRDGEAGIGFITNLAVTATHRGQGIGRRLLNHAMEYFRQHGLTHVRIETLDQNPVGEKLYRDIGFVEVARQIHFCAKLS